MFLTRCGRLGIVRPREAQPWRYGHRSGPAQRHPGALEVVLSESVGPQALLDFKLLFESVPGMHMVMDRALTIVATTDLYLQNTMTSRESLIGRNVFDAFPDNPDDAGATGSRDLRDSLERVLHDGVPDTMPMLKYDIRKPESEGGEFEVRYWSVVNTPVLDRAGTLAYIVQRVEDVTEFMRLTQLRTEQVKLTDELREQTRTMESEIFLRARALDDANQRLWDVNQELQSRNRGLQQLATDLEVANRHIQEANRLKSEFLANMSHELRTPLNAIIGFSELMYDDAIEATPEQSHEFLGHIQGSGRHLLQLINDVLDLAKVESGKMDFRPEKVDLGSLMNELASILRTTSAQKQIRLVVQCHPDLAEVVLDGSRLKQVLYNFLSNAIKFTGPGGSVTARAFPTLGGLFRLEVQDTGVGIAPEDISRLFVEFQQLDAGAAKKHAGTGLGLALTRRLVQAQGGEVGVESQVGQGSTFFALLPRHATLAQQLPKPRWYPAARVGAPTVLVVEDNQEDQELIVAVLTQAGYSVETASTGAQALSRCATRKFDAITLDLLLPDISGLDVLGAVREGGPNQHAHVVVITVVAEKGAVGGFAVHDVLAKPLQAPALLESLVRAGVDVDLHGTVLVVDDDPASLELMNVALHKLGFTAACFPNAAEALAALSGLQPQAIVLDLMMPGMSGFEFLEHFRALADHRHTPVLIWSAKELTEDERSTLHRSAQAVVRKGGTAALLEQLGPLLPPISRTGAADRR
jgi:signal transduction histidine kinase/DNA-binding response OmpR family regulator